MSKLSILMFAAALVIGLFSAQSGAFAQTDEEAPPAAADQPAAPDEDVLEGTDQGAPKGAEVPRDEDPATEMPPDEDTEQEPNPNEE